jgi:hypothetical protein
MMQLRALTAFIFQLKMSSDLKCRRHSILCMSISMKNLNSHITLMPETNLAIKLLAISEYLTVFLSFNITDLLPNVMHASYINVAH